MSLFFFFNDTATTEIYTLSLHDALPIWRAAGKPSQASFHSRSPAVPSWSRRPSMTLLPSRFQRGRERADRKSTRLNSSHANISYAVFCLKKKKTDEQHKTASSVHLK